MSNLRSALVVAQTGKVKCRLPWPDILAMSKRAMLWMVGLIAFGFTYVAAVNVKELGGSSLGYYTTCKGMWNATKWFADSCSESLPPRLGGMTIGLIALVVFGYFGEKGAAPRAVHRVFRDPRDGLYWCAGCGQFTFVRSEAARHLSAWSSTFVSADKAWDARSKPEPRANSNAAPSEVWTSPRLVAESPEPPQELGQQDQRSESAPVQANPEFKTCPDCAEEVRFGARKCRFCQYQFEHAQPA